MNIAEKIFTFQQLGKVSTKGVFVFDLSAKSFTYFNNRFPELFGLTAEGILNDPMVISGQIIQEDVDYLTTLIKSLKKDRHFTDIEFQLNAEPSKHIAADIYYFHEESIVVGFLKNITPQKVQEQYIVNFGAKKNALLEMLAHNLSGPLKLSQRVLEGSNKRVLTVKTLKEQIEFARKVNEECINTINTLLQEEHFLSERLYIAQHRFDAIEKVKVTLEQYQNSHPGQILTLTTRHEHLYVNSDDVRFMQIVSNLLSNAVKFTPVNCTIEVDVRDTESSFQLIVKDDGIGIPTHLQPLIFVRYSPAGRTGLNGEKSIGVGLSIVKRLTELMGGRIEFTSRENQGSTFIVTLPKNLRKS